MNNQQENIQLYTWGTPNGRKISIALEEMNLDYDVHAIDITKGEQFSETFRAISHNSKIPLILDPVGAGGTSTIVFESGAILIYLAEKTGRFLGSEPDSRSLVLQWLMWQMGSFGPVLGQLHHFRKFAKENIPYGIKRFDEAADQVYRTLDKRLADNEFMAGDYSIADMATYPWVARFEWQSIDLSTYPQAKRWFDGLSDRKAVTDGMHVPFLN